MSISWHLEADVPAGTLQVLIRDYLPADEMAPGVGDGARSYVDMVSDGPKPQWMQDLYDELKRRGIYVELYAGNRADRIVDRLNEIETKDAYGPSQNSAEIWDYIHDLDEWDETRTAELDPSGSGDRFALADGTVIRYGLGSYGGSAHSPHAAGWYVQA